MMQRLTNKARKLFVDTLRIKVEGGDGGHGLPHYGGIGGKGGDVYIKGSLKHDTLKHINTQAVKKGVFKAGNGQASLRTRLLGKPGTDLMVKVPVGVTVSDIDGQHIADVDDAKTTHIVAMGGRGGDKYNDSHGFVGQKRVLRLDLKLISDAVFVGFPNAGKSSLLRAISSAKPAVADYPFTTLRPYKGVIKFPDYRQITIADLPGLVEGAHMNLGLGHEFLKHIVRSRVLIFVIDINNADLGTHYKSRSPIETFCILNKEIEMYNDSLLSKPSLCVLTKTDTLDEVTVERRVEEFKTSLEQIQEKEESDVDEDLRPRRVIELSQVLPISSETKQNLEELKQATRKLIDDYEEMAKLERDKFVSYEDLRPLEFNRLSIEGKSS